jgi:alpha-tubulin suppressor-like RCC1 family protein
VPVAGGLSFTRLTGGRYGFTCSLASGGAAYCWGYNGTGALGRGDTASSTMPAPVAGGLTFTEIAAGDNFACGRTTAGTVSCWGSNTDGAMGQGYLGIESPRPLSVQGGVAFASVATGLVHSCGLTTDGTAWCWGSNQKGEIGTGDSVSSATPRPVVGGLHFVQLALGDEDSCGLTAAGALYCWGRKGPPRPTRVEPSTTFLSISSVFGYPKLCGVRADSTAFCPIRSGFAGGTAPTVSGRRGIPRVSFGPPWRYR